MPRPLTCLCPHSVTTDALRSMEISLETFPWDRRPRKHMHAQSYTRAIISETMRIKYHQTQIPQDLGESNSGPCAVRPSCVPSLRALSSFSGQSDSSFHSLLPSMCVSSCFAHLFSDWLYFPADCARAGSSSCLFPEKYLCCHLSCHVLLPILCSILFIKYAKSTQNRHPLGKQSKKTIRGDGC